MSIVYRGVSGIVKRKYNAARACTVQKATMLRHILSAASWQSAPHCAGLAAVTKEFLAATTQTNETSAAPRLPKPCLRAQSGYTEEEESRKSDIANTEFIKAPRHFTVANSEVITEDRG